MADVTAVNIMGEVLAELDFKIHTTQDPDERDELQEKFEALSDARNLLLDKLLDGAVTLTQEDLAEIRSVAEEVRKARQHAQILESALKLIVIATSR